MLIAAFGKTPSIDEKPSITANDFFVPCFPGSPLYYDNNAQCTMRSYNLIIWKERVCKLIENSCIVYELLNNIITLSYLNM